MASRDPQPQYHLPPDLAPGYQWIEPISIDDDDIMWGGKSLRAWCEEERRRVRAPSEEEERRGRQMVSTRHLGGA